MKFQNSFWITWVWVIFELLGLMSNRFESWCITHFATILDLMGILKGNFIQKNSSCTILSRKILRINCKSTYISCWLNLSRNCTFRFLANKNSQIKIAHHEKYRFKFFIYCYDNHIFKSNISDVSMNEFYLFLHLKENSKILFSYINIVIFYFSRIFPIQHHNILVHRLV